MIPATVGRRGRPPEGCVTQHAQMPALAAHTQDCSCNVIGAEDASSLLAGRVRQHPAEQAQQSCARAVQHHMRRSINAGRVGIAWLLLTCCSWQAAAQYGFEGLPIATIMPEGGVGVGWLHISPIINTTESALLLQDSGHKFGRGWMGGNADKADVGSPDSVDWLHLTNGSVNSFLHIDGVSAAVRPTLNGQLRGKAGVKALTKAAPGPGLARPTQLAATLAVNTNETAGIDRRLIGLSAYLQQQQQGGQGPGRRRLLKLPPPQSTPLDTPDPSICVGKGFMVQIVQQVIAVFSTRTGRLLAGPTSLSDFFGVHDGGLFSFTYCIADLADSKAFFVGALHTVNEDGGPQNRSLLVGPTSTTLYLASSMQPLAAWRGPFVINVTGLDPNNPGLALPGLDPCSEPHYMCYADYVSYGLNADALWVSANLIPVNDEGFLARSAAGTVLMGISKSSLLIASASNPLLVAYSNFPDSVEFLALSIPQTSKAPQADAALGNVQYIAHSVQDDVPPSLLFWAAVQTQRISKGFPGGRAPRFLGPVHFPLEHDLVPPTQYFPEGLPTPGASTNKLKLQGARPTQLSLVSGMLYTAISTVVTYRGSDTVGAMYVVAQPHMFADEMGIESVAQGLVGASRTWNILCPALTANPQGKMVMAFSLAGLREDQDLTAGYVPIDPHTGPGDIRVTAGVAPVAIGGYVRGLVPQGRYSTVVAGEGGHVWMVSQWQQSMLIWSPNWGTLITKADPSVYP